MAIHQDIINRGCRTYPAVYFTSPTFPGLELHAAKNKTSVLQEGHPGTFWDDVVNAPPPPVMGEITVPNQLGVEIDLDVFLA